MKTIQTTAIACFAVLVLSCTYGNRLSYEPNSRAPTDPASIEIVDSHNIKRPYKVIGIVTSESYYMSSALKRCRSEAAKLGANAMMDFGPTGSQTGVFTYGSGIAIGGTSNTGWSAKAIAWER